MNVDVVGKSSIDENIPLHGRPYGGCAIIYKINIKGKIAKVICNPRHLCGVCLIINNNCTILILNAYMPCDNNMQDDNFATYMAVMGEVEQIIHSLNPTHIIFGGDLNTDLARSSPHVKDLNQNI